MKRQYFPNTRRLAINVATILIILLTYGSLTILLVKPAYANSCTILIDPGHGGSDPGALSATSPVIYEKDVVWDIGVLLNDILQKRGFSAQLSRSENGNPSLDDRVKNGRSINANLMVSIHANAAKDTFTPGIEVLYRESFLGKQNPYLAESIAFAEHLLAELLTHTGHNSRGVKNSTAAWQSSVFPIAIAEIGYMKDSAALDLMLNQPKLYAEALADGIENYVDEYGCPNGGESSTQQTESCQNEATFINQSSYQTVAPGEQFEVFFELENNGSCTWKRADGYVMRNVNNTPLGANQSQYFGEISPGGRFRLEMVMQAPSVGNDGDVYRTAWMLSQGDQPFGPQLYLDIELEAPAAQGIWQACSNTYPSQLNVGMQAYVGFDPPSANNVRQTPYLDSDLSGQIQPGEQVEIIKGPSCSNRWVWWKIRSLESGLVGWTSEGDSDDYWLLPAPDEFSQFEALLAGYTFQVSPGGPRCGETESTQRIVELAISANGDELNVTVTKCDGGAFSKDGVVYLAVDGREVWGPYRYSGGSSTNVNFIVNPVAQGYVGQHSYLAHVYPDGQSYPIVSGSQVVSAISQQVQVPAQPDPDPDPTNTPRPQPTSTPVPVQKAPTYKVTPGGEACGTTPPTQGIIALNMKPWNDGEKISVLIFKCERGYFSKDGKVYLAVDDEIVWGPYYYQGMDDSFISFKIDPVVEGIYGKHTYQAHIYPEGQDHPILSGVQYAWDE